MKKMNKRRKSMVLGLALCAVLGGSQTVADPPTLIRYQAQLTDNAGIPLVNRPELFFEIYDAEAGGNQLWFETYPGEPNCPPVCTTPGVQFDNGVVEAQLGTNTALPLSVFAAPDRWLAVTVDGAALTPRQRLSSVPYALASGLLGDRTVDELSGSLDEAYALGQTITADLGPVTVEANGTARILARGTAGANTTRAEFIADRTASERGGGLRIVTAGVDDWWIGVGYNGGGASEKFIIDTNDRIHDGAHLVIDDATGNVGIGALAPSERLSVVGRVESTSGGFKFPDGSVQATAAGTTSAAQDINLACAAVGCFAGDGPGLPVKITQSGSYRLTSNLSAISPAANAIDIAASNVVLDMSGHTISGAAADGITSTVAVLDVSIVNGTVSGCGGNGIGLVNASAVTLTDVRVFGNTTGIRTGVSSLLTRIIAKDNSGTGIFTSDAHIEGCVVENSGSNGIFATNSVIRNNISRNNQGAGIRNNGRGIIEDNEVDNNAQYGIFVNGGDVLIANNLVTRNSLEGIWVLGTRSTIRDNHLSDNAVDAIRAGTNGQESSHVITGNSISLREPVPIGSLTAIRFWGNSGVIDGNYVHGPFSDIDNQHGFSIRIEPPVPASHHVCISRNFVPGGTVFSSGTSSCSLPTSPWSNPTKNR